MNNVSVDRTMWIPVLPYLVIAAGITVWSVLSFPIAVAAETLWFLLATFSLIGAQVQVSRGHLLPVSTGIQVAAMLVLPLQAVALYAAVVALVFSVRAGRSVERTAFNIANYVVPTVAGALLFQWLKPFAQGAMGTPGLLVTAVLAMGLRFLLNTSLAHIRIAMVEQRSPLEGIGECLLAEFWTAIGLQSVALLMVVAYQAIGIWTLPVAVLLFFSLSHAIQFYAQRESLTRMTYTDGLTGVRNRLAWEEQVQKIGTASLDSCLLAVVDLNGMKRLNDTIGHLEGDRAIRELAGRLAGIVGADQVYRYGGDEFVVLLPGVAKADTLVARLLRTVQEFGSEWVARGVVVGASAGIAAAPVDGKNLLELFRVADQQMYKRKGRHIRCIAGNG